MNNNPPIIRRREVLKRFCGRVSAHELAKWEECDIIHPFRPAPNDHKWYYTAEIERILNGPTTTQ